MFPPPFFVLGPIGSIDGHRSGPGLADRRRACRERTVRARRSVGPDHVDPVDPRRRRSKMAWFSPDPRGIIPLDGLHVSRSLRRSMRRFEVRMDTRFTDVARACGDPRRPGRWITEPIVEAYGELFALGWGHSVEVFLDDELVGGLYGVALGRIFFGESMFSRATDASKIALATLVAHLRRTQNPDAAAPGEPDRLPLRPRRGARRCPRRRRRSVPRAAGDRRGLTCRPSARSSTST